MVSPSMILRFITTLLSTTCCGFITSVNILNSPNSILGMGLVKVKDCGLKRTAPLFVLITKEFSLIQILRSAKE